MAVAPSALTDALQDRFTFERELGRGGMGLVFLARDLRHNRRVAFKVIRPELASVVGAERFVREIQLAAQLQHPNIVPVYESGECEGTLYFVMPYVEGESLRARLRREAQLPLDEALRYARDLAEALTYAHARGVVHRDIKPENILLAGGHALVADFGIARAIAAAGPDRLTETGLVIGTPAYMSPEQASGSPTLDGRADIYSLACVVYEMLAGEPPYTGPSSQAILAKRLSEPIPHVRTVRDSVPVGVEHAVTKALAKVPADRFATAAQFAAALTSDSVEMAPTTPAAPLTPRRRRWWPPVAGAAGIAILGIAAALAFRQRHGSTPPLAAASTDPHRVVVAVFANRTSDSSLDPLGDIISDYLARGFAETRLVQVIDARTQRSGDRTARSGDAAGARALARAAGAGEVVWGAYYRHGDSLQFQAQFTNVATGELIGTTPPVVGSATQQTQGVERLRQGVMSLLAARVDPRFAQYRSAHASEPANYDAYLEFLSGDDMNQRGVGCVPERDCRADALAHYRRAYALDSTFTLPIIWVAVESRLDGACARTDSIAEVLRPRHDRLALLDRAQLDWAVASCHGHRAAALEEARRAMMAAPQSDRLAMVFAWVARHNGRLREALAVSEKVDLTRHGDDDMYWGNLIIPYHLLGEHQRELDACQRARRFLPDDVQLRSMEARALVGLGRLDEVNARLDEMARTREAAQVDDVSGLIDDVGRDLLAHGYPQEARAAFARGIHLITTQPAKEQPHLRIPLAVLLYDAGRWDEAAPIAKQFVAENPNDLDAHSLLGAVAARLRDGHEVARIERWLAARTGPYLNGTPTFARARLAAILGDRDRAVTLYRQALDEGFGIDKGLGFHSDPDFAGLRDYPPFQELTRLKD